MIRKARVVRLVRFSPGLWTIVTALLPAELERDLRIDRHPDGRPRRPGG
ncbi:hypothetical protein [Actinoplanes sp. NPDC026619]